MSLMQLQAFADVEVRDRPGSPGQTHIAQWAVVKIERLMWENAALRTALSDWLDCADSPEELMRCRHAAKIALGRVAA